MMKDFLIAVKRTKWERDLRTYGSEEKIRQIYQIQNNAYDRVFASHQRQKESFELVKQTLKNSDFFFREDLKSASFENYRCIASLGGDNHFVYVSRFAKSPIAGINSDPKSSRGALLAGNASEFVQFYSQFDSTPEEDKASFLQKRITERWSRIECTIIFPNGDAQNIGACTSEFSIRNRFAEYMSRYLIRKRLAHSEEGAPPFKEEKCSGLLCATGAGSTGWFKSCLPVEERNHAVFSRSAPFFEYLAREALQPMPPARVQSDEALEIISEMDGEIVADSDHELSFSFPYGARAILKLAGERLSVIHEF
ncbi:MAG TPA: hypothetical protein PKE49_15270 [Leptospiraceae bacterium]|jgi:NAD kinase|nr:hypothetical protein [Leptospiraceae bacterium]HMY46108.1 hypothetical protein [Leptospiraceae bacterium]HMZ38358.1 hypothetical protein [Leptospiraceae bacterium]HNJ34899.1 hypothetical protein [Leptospiraceae bacterium]HNN75508.1 hypothetical protein [Leptospiraceae bacterium]